jgi:hypothetical protein
MALNTSAAMAAPNAKLATVVPVAQAEPNDAEDAERASPEELQARIRDLEQRLEQTNGLITGRRPTVMVGGYADIGFFVPQGSGAGIIRDNGNIHFPEYKDRYGWVFLGDLLAPAVNSRGEAADLGDAVGAPRFDSIHSGGAPGFVANEVNLTLTSGLTENVLGTASVNFVPRSGQAFALGDFLDVDIAQIEWLPTADHRTSVFVGKFDSLIGIEYRERKANQRFGITPSLIARYTVGTALGLKVRSKFGPNDMLVLAGAVTNGSNTTEQFHFYDEIDRNAAKTASGRIGLRPLPLLDLELGLSGAYGAQDRATDSNGKMSFWGVDLLGHFGPVDLKMQWLKGKAPGKAGEDVYGLDLHGGGYAEIDWMITPVVGVMSRIEFRDAFVWLGDAQAAEGANRAYLTKSWRQTTGLRLALAERIIGKAEYLRNGEYGGIPDIRNDVLTMSLVFLN